jgi:hypothetical protein
MNKSRFFLGGLAALALTLGLVLAGCDNLASTLNPLTFKDSPTYDIPPSTVGTAIGDIYVDSGVSGGSDPYSFTAEGLPAGISISTDGKISGTPTAVTAAGTAWITVTDSEGTTKRIQINVGAVSAGSGPAGIIGTWTGIFQGLSVTYVVTSSGWTSIIPDMGIEESGTYTLSGNTATLIYDGVTIGTATVSGNILTLELNANSGNAGTYTLTRGGGISGITFTGIDSRYNGQYASFRSSGGTQPAGGDYLMGGSSISSSGITGVQISGGSVTIPVYLVQESSQTGTSYTGNDTSIKIYLSIKNSPSYTFADLGNDTYKKYTINSVDFTNGSASVNVSGLTATLIIQNVPANVFAYGADGLMIGVFPYGTTFQDAYTQQEEIIVAGVDSNEDIGVSGSGPYTLTIPVDIIDSSSWNGNGTYTVFVVLGDMYGGNAHFYHASSVTFSSGTATILFNSVTELDF